jgi:hypothetical protein
MGVLLDGAVAQQVASFWAYLIEIGLFVEVE